MSLGFIVQNQTEGGIIFHFIQPTTFVVDGGDRGGGVFVFVVDGFVVDGDGCVVVDTVVVDGFVVVDAVVVVDSVVVVVGVFLCDGWLLIIFIII